MGARIAVARAFALHDSDRRHVSLEFSLAAIFPSRTGDLRGGSLASKAGVTDPGYSGAWTCRLDRRRSIDLPRDRVLRFAAQLDSDWTRCGLVVFRVPAARFRISLLGTRRDHVLRVARHVSLRSDELWSSALQFFSRTRQTCAARSAAALPQCISMGGAYLLYSKQTPTGRPNATTGKHLDVGGIAIHQWLQPHPPAGVAREFETSIHGEINPDVGTHLLNNQAGRDGQLALMGVDGIVVAREVDIAPQPSSEWELVVSTEEGNVFHRRSAPFSRVRSVTSIDSRPNEAFVLATIPRINDSRNFVNADIDVPAGGRSALLTFSRPYFRGYKARIGDQKLAITSYRGLFPILEIPAGTHGRLTVAYRPAWLLLGGGVAAVCGLIVVLGFVAAWRYSSSSRTESCP